MSFTCLAFASNNLVIDQVLFPNEAVVTLLARIIGILGPIDMEMLQNGQETNKYFTDDHELYCLNEVSSHISKRNFTISFLALFIKNSLRPPLNVTS